MLMEVKRQQGQEAGAGLLQWLLALVLFQTTYAQCQQLAASKRATARRPSFYWRTHRCIFQNRKLVKATVPNGWGTHKPLMSKVQKNASRQPVSTSPMSSGCSGTTCLLAASSISKKVYLAPHRVTPAWPAPMPRPWWARRRSARLWRYRLCARRVCAAGVWRGEGL